MVCGALPSSPTLATYTLVLISISHCLAGIPRIVYFRAECPRKKNGGNAGFGEAGAVHPGAKAPGVVPPETLISCTFMHNDKSGLYIVMQ